MNKVKYSLPGVFLIFASFFFLPSLLGHIAYAVSPKAIDTNVTAKVGEFSLSVSGFISPFASIILTSDGIYLASTVADSNGNFSFSGIPINRGFSGFCLDAIDFKRLGESYVCIDIPPATGNVNVNDLFLPPTIGISNNTILENQSVKLYGYSMPNAWITLHLNNGKTIRIQANSNGYYNTSVNNLKAGDYSFYATAELNNKQSLVPNKKVNLKSLTLWEKIVEFLKRVWVWLVSLFTSILALPLWLNLLLLILIFIFVFKILPRILKTIRNNLPSKASKKRLHHFWWLGY